MKYATYISTAFILASFLLVVGSDFARAEINVLQPKGETGWSIGDNTGIRDFVEDTFGNNHTMVDVARCESGFRQYYSGGDVLIAGDANAVGIFQLLEGWHKDPASELGYDIYTVEGNIGYAKELYEAEGLKPWSPSSLCWDDGRVDETNVDGTSRDDSTKTKMIIRRSGSDDDEAKEQVSDNKDEDVADNESDDDSDQRLLTSAGDDDSESNNLPTVVSKKLIIGVDDPEVKVLQELLNNLGYELTSSGPGSPGEETSFFGSLTKQALQKFQCDENIACSGVEYTTGFGMTDAKTRATLNKKAAETSNETASSRVRMPVRSSSGSRENTNQTEDTRNSDLQAEVKRLTQIVDDLRIRLEQ